VKAYSLVVELSDFDPDLMVKHIHNGREMYDVVGVEQRIGENGNPYLVFKTGPEAPEILP
jgi:hypothetical protein